MVSSPIFSHSSCHAFCGVAFLISPLALQLVSRWPTPSLDHDRWRERYSREYQGTYRGNRAPKRLLGTALSLISLRRSSVDKTDYLWAGFSPAGSPHFTYLLDTRDGHVGRVHAYKTFTPLFVEKMISMTLSEMVILVNRSRKRGSGFSRVWVKVTEKTRGGP